MSSSDWGNNGSYGGYSGDLYSPYGQQPSKEPSHPHYMTPGPAVEDEFANEPPLLEELGINVEHIMAKTYAVLNPLHVTHPDVAGDSDLAGPLVFCLAFGSFLLLCGKLHFNYIYGIGFLGCISMYGLISMMSSHVSLPVVVSILGYCILPIVMLSGISVIFSLQGFVGNIITGGAVLWCAASASNLFVTAFRMEHQQVLMAYPCSLLYAVFALITIF
eukprot:TRINITY_DN4502_c0_g1_i1.p1 TRINITY_DN4502_c0_g1~~TRINITY_DN4502_c0_g1_i1.p1  ORF type:complete len:218 (+),score=69.92 TRINITY_DN4502_c0_g1_i1:248-901(+)